MARYPTWEPTQAERERITFYASRGMRWKDIGFLIGKHPATIAEKCQEDYDRGIAHANLKVADTLYGMATGTKGEDGRWIEPPQPAAAFFWAKTRMGWSERNGGRIADEMPLIPQEAFDKLSDDEIAFLERIASKLGGAQGDTGAIEDAEAARIIHARGDD